MIADPISQPTAVPIIMAITEENSMESGLNPKKKLEIIISEWIVRPILRDTIKYSINPASAKLIHLRNNAIMIQKRML